MGDAIMTSTNRGTHIAIRFAASLVVLSCSALTGCRRGPSLVPVEGRVVFEHTPLTTGVIMMQPEAGPAAQARIQPDGSFRLGTFVADDGAIVGRAAVRVMCRKELTKPGEERSFGRSLIPEKYGQFESSGLSVEITAGMTPLLIELSRD